MPELPDITVYRNDKITVDEIREVLMHSAIYAGVPLCVDAVRAAREVIAEAGRG